MKTTLMTNGNLFPALPSLIEDFFNRNWMDTASGQRLGGSTLPAVNIYETNDQFKIEVAAPGMKRENFNIELDNYILRISAELKEEGKEQTDQFTRREFYYGSFERSFALPENKIDGEHVEAKYNDGILHITVPKREEAKVKPARQISIS
jgi:HSP20 family protein